MDRNSLIKKYARSDEEKLLLSHVCDLADRAQTQWRSVCTEFLTPAEQVFLERVTEIRREVEVMFWGGYEGAERRIMVFYPDEYSKPDLLDIPVDILEIKTRGGGITHRDILGSLMGLQIQRNRIGDILDKHTPPLFMCHRDVSIFVMQNLEKIGRNGVEIAYGEIRALPEQEYDEHTVTVASVRLDSVVGEAFGISRTKAADKIRSGAVQVNWETADNTAMELKEGDSISLRGSGKAVLSEIGGTSKKGRVFLKIRVLK